MPGQLNAPEQRYDGMNMEPIPSTGGTSLLPYCPLISPKAASGRNQAWNLENWKQEHHLCRWSLNSHGADGTTPQRDLPNFNYRYHQTKTLWSKRVWIPSELQIQGTRPAQVCCTKQMKPEEEEAPTSACCPHVRGSSFLLLTFTVFV